MRPPWWDSEKRSILQTGAGCNATGTGTPDQPGGSAASPEGCLWWDGAGCPATNRQLFGPTMPCRHGRQQAAATGLAAGVAPEPMVRVATAKPRPPALSQTGSRMQDSASYTPFTPESENPWAR